MTSFATLAVNSAAAVRMIQADRIQHREACSLCRPDVECPYAAALTADHASRVQRARSNLLVFLPRGSVVTYAGDRRNQHGSWWVADTCHDCDHTAYRLVRPHGATIEHISIAEITSAPVLHPGAGEALAAAREAAREMAAVLAACRVTLPVIVDVNGLGACCVAYPRATWEHEVSVSESRDDENASYAQAALRLLPALAAAARNGNAGDIAPITDALRKVQNVIREARTRA
ncbi:hypothetical protein [Nonomuraea sp. SYSU D8015]|uniref:hypothetical protein n=1 Tax=Nonomuraea sp. SYSU D8015 TaxID=2593644 RepID=UPI0016607A2A|nr:hypothetical protein [Nonomuraea sp. SYSU D8015]